MQKWEYMYLTAEEKYDSGKFEWWVKAINGQIVGSKPDFYHNFRHYPRLSDVLTRLGNEGWELVAVDKGCYTFKRPVPT